MDDRLNPTAGASPTPGELQAVLNRLLDEAEGGGGGDPPSSGAVAVPVSAPVGVQPSSPPADGNPGASPGGNPMGNLLGTLMGNPTMLAALPTLAENLAPLLGTMTHGTGSGQGATRPHTVDRHTALLCAVKPYLSPRRREAAETVIRLCRIWDALERSGISLTGLLGGLGGAEPSERGSSTPSEGEVT